MDYICHILVLITIYMVLGVSLNLVAGYAGFLSLAHAAFYGIGAYLAALMAIHLHAPFLVSLFCVAGVTGIFGGFLALPALRVRGDYFVITTFAFQVIVVSVLANWTSVTGGAMGLAGIPPARIFDWTLRTNVDYLIVAASLAFALWWLVRTIVRSPFGRVLKSIREDDALVALTGKDVRFYKVLVFVIGSSVASVAGVLYVHYITFIDPSNFTVMESIFILSIVILGGAGNLWGPLLGAILLVSFPELLRFLGIPTSAAANIRQILYGLALVACMLWRPQGLVGEFTFGRDAKTK